MKTKAEKTVATFEPGHKATVVRFIGKVEQKLVENGKHWTLSVKKSK